MSDSAERIYLGLTINDKSFRVPRMGFLISITIGEKSIY